MVRRFILEETDTGYIIYDCQKNIVILGPDNKEFTDFLTAWRHWLQLINNQQSDNIWPYK